MSDFFILPQPTMVALPSVPSGTAGPSGAPGADATDMGLLADAAAATIPTTIKKVSTRGRSATDVGGAKYVEGTAPTSRSGFTSANSRNFVLSKEQVIVPQMFYEATDSDFQNAMEAARDYLATFNLNTNGGGFYGGAPKLFAPAGHYDMHSRVDFAHTGKFEGEGDGFFGPGAGGCTKFNFTGTTSGFGFQGTNTNAITGVDGSSHAGSGGFDISDMCIAGDYSGTEGDYFALVCRIGTRATNLYLKNWRGDGIRAWAGNVTGASNVGGNLSTSRFDGIKTENCRGGIDIRGSDANVITTINCQGYQNRQFGLIDDNGAGSNTHEGWHCASNGLITTTTGPYTQCSYSGNRYAAKWGGTFTTAPSGTTADTANWIYIEAGGAITNLIPTWTSTAGLFRAGADYLTLNNAGVYIDNDYSEGGGFSQFSNLTIINHGTIGDQYYRGGIRLVPRSDGYSIRMSGTSKIYMDSVTASEGQIVVRDRNVTEIGFIDISSGGVQLAAAAGNVYFKLGGSFVSHIDNNGFYYDSGGNKVLGARGAAVTDAVAAAAAPTQAEFNAFVTQFNAWLARARAHGFIA